MVLTADLLITGVKFLYECVMGLRKHEGQGCILADEMYVDIFHASHRTFPELHGTQGGLAKRCR